MDTWLENSHVMDANSQIPVRSEDGHAKTVHTTFALNAYLQDLILHAASPIHSSGRLVLMDIWQGHLAATDANRQKAETEEDGQARNVPTQTVLTAKLTHV